jgi:hypothetical protein
MRRTMFLRRATIWLATIGYALVVSGLPLPLGGGQPASPTSAAAKRLAGKDRSQPFPCMDKPCGCATAEQCFSSCCCNTPAELLAWARAMKADPGVVAALVRRATTSAPAAERCCAAAQSECCAAAAESPMANSDDQCCSAQASPIAVGDEPCDTPTHGVSLRAMRACKGLAAEWLSIGVALPPVAPAVVSCVADTPSRIACFDVSISGSRVAPDAPPPRRA